MISTKVTAMDKCIGKKLTYKILKISFLSILNSKLQRFTIQYYLSIKNFQAMVKAPLLGDTEK